MRPASFFRVLFILFFVFCVGRAGANVRTEHINEEREMEVWVKLDRLNEAEVLIAAGRKKEAEIVLDALIEKYPDYGEAKELYKKLEADTGEFEGSRDIVAGEKSERGEDIWRIYQELKKSGDIAGARKKMLELKELYKGVEVLPVFLSDMEKESVGIEKDLEKALGEAFSGIETRLSGISRINDPESRLPGLVGLYTEIRSILALHRDLPRALGLKSEIVRHLKRSARVVYSKAAMLKALEGCCLARPAFERLLDTLVYPELEIYQLTRKEVVACEN